MKIIRLNGKIINVGAWDYGKIIDEETDEVLAITNPLPNGAVESEEDYVPVVKLNSDTVLSRLTPAEREALFTARRTVWQVDYFLTRASTTGIVSTSDPDLDQAKVMFAQLGIITADRWTELLAP